jgi:tetratricopeptide (TPR) repeat protein
VYGWFIVNLALMGGLAALLILPHELGHALAAQLLGLRVFAIHVGTGRTLLATKLCGVRLEWKAIPAAGITLFGHPTLSFFRLRRFLTILAGPAVNVALVCLVLSLVPAKELFPPGQPQRGFQDLIGDRLPHGILLPAAFLLANLLILGVNLWPRVVWVGTLQCEDDGLALLTTPRLSSDAIQQRHALYFYLEGRSCSEDKRFAAAADWHRRGLDHYSDDVFNRSGLGLALFELGDFAGARNQWLSLLQRTNLDLGTRTILSNNVAAASLLLAGSALARPPSAEANLPEREALHREAEELSREAFCHAPWMPHCKGTRGCVLVEQGKVADGLVLLREAMLEHKDAEEKAFCASFIALGEAKMGRLTEAKKLLDSARKLDPKCVAVAVVAGQLATPPNPSQEGLLA